MSRDPREESFAAHLCGAFESGSDCPAPEVFLEDEWTRLSPAERARIEAHAATCPACAAERDLAALWDLPAEAGDLAAEDLAYVVGRIEEAQAEPALPERSNVVPFPSGRIAKPSVPTDVRQGLPVRRAGRTFAGWGLALAAVLALGIGLLVELRRSDLPALPPAPAGAETYRGSTVLLRGPEGELEAAPVRLEWEATPGAATYRVRIADPLGEEVWSGTAERPALDLSGDAAAKLQTAVVYSWTVEAVDAGGQRIAGSEALKFRIAP